MTLQPEDGKMIFVEVTGHFDAAHKLENHPAKCARLHGHRWGVTLKLGISETSMVGDMVVDFGDLKRKILRPILDDILDHSYLNENAELQERLCGMRPTAENLARVLYRWFVEALAESKVFAETAVQKGGLTVAVSVSVQEAPGQVACCQGREILTIPDDRQAAGDENSDEFSRDSKESLSTEGTLPVSVDHLINEVFLAPQGEGPFAGVLSVFARLQGCSADCTACDTPAAKPVLNPPEGMADPSVEELALAVVDRTVDMLQDTAAEVANWGYDPAPGRVVSGEVPPKPLLITITGGEPLEVLGRCRHASAMTLRRLRDFIVALESGLRKTLYGALANGLHFAVETNGLVLYAMQESLGSALRDLHFSLKDRGIGLTLIISPKWLLGWDETPGPRAGKLECMYERSQTFLRQLLAQEFIGAITGGLSVALKLLISPPELETGAPSLDFRCQDIFIQKLHEIQWQEFQENKRVSDPVMARKHLGTFYQPLLVGNARQDALAVRECLRQLTITSPVLHPRLSVQQHKFLRDTYAVNTDRPGDLWQSMEGTEEQK